MTLQSGTHFAVLRIDYSSNDTTLWMDPSLTAFAGTGGFTLNSCSPVFNRIALFGRSGAQFDEIRIGTTAQDVGLTTVPEPATLALFGVGLAGLGWRCPRKAS